MPDDVVIKVENLSKQYRIGVHEGYKTFRETLVDTVKAPFQRLSSLLSASRSKLSSPDDTIWALKDVSFEVKQGEVIGIIGRNGAGKSTLLKILSKITEPTEGRVELRGRVGSLLEVGTGFHPELTGHENVYLYGAILGMDRWEVTRKFDEIVAFAEVEKFIETPVKRYSSGMYMRLAFAVAAHMETEILLVDEVLAVGDAAFQKKCMWKMGDLSKEGRTVLFVSHNLDAVRKLCGKGILIENGIKEQLGPVDSVIETYTKSFDEIREFPKSSSIILENFKIHNDRQQELSNFYTGENIHFTFSLFCNEVLDSERVNVGITIINRFDDRVMHITEEDDNAELRINQKKNRAKIGVLLPNAPLPPGEYWIDIWFGNNSLCNTYLFVERVKKFRVFYGQFTGRKSDFPKHVKIPQKSRWNIS